ncbi:MAG: M20/M25/M40 family metallo-hydrolase [Isosphaeraceae bacterium]
MRPSPRWPGLAVAAWLVLVPSLALAADQTDVEKILAAARDDSQVMAHLDVLSNRIGPRLTSSDNLTNACEWARDTFASYGLDARMEKWGEFPVGFNRGPWFGRVVEPEARPLEFITMSWSAGTKGLARGAAVLAPKDAKALEELKPKLAGAWVLSPLPDRSGPRPDPEFLRSLPKVYEEAKVAGVIRSSTGALLLTSGNQNVKWDSLPKVPTVTLLKAQFDEILGWVKAGKPVTLEFDIRNYFKKGPVPLYNVIADLRGTEKPDEYVIVGGHIDSWDGATGTTDNGTGCATTIEAARLLVKAGVKPKRTIRFMLWSGEEQGLLGSAAYVRAHKDLMPRISAVLVHDGGTNYLSGISATEAMLSDLEQVFDPVKSLDPKMPFAVRKVAGLFGGGSDHASFLSANVPGFFWGQAGKAVYNRTHHTQHDTYDSAVEEYQKHSAIVAAVGALGIANLDHLLSREKLRAPGGGAFANRRMLGVGLDEMTVTDVIEDGVAAKAGVKAGDVIAKIDGKKVADRMELTAALRDGPSKKSLTVLRNGKEVEVTVEWPIPAPARPTTTPAPAPDTKKAQP